MASKTPRPISILYVLGIFTCIIELRPSMKRLNNLFHVSKLSNYLTRESEYGLNYVLINTEGIFDQDVYKIQDKKKKIETYSTSLYSLKIHKMTVSKKRNKNCKDVKLNTKS